MIQPTNSLISNLLASLPAGPDSEASRLIQKAYDFACTAHGDHRRESGELYIDHVTAVAQTMLELDVDTNTIAASLLHKSLQPHTGKTEQDLKQNFNTEIVGLVVGLRNLYNYATKDSYKQHQAQQPDTKSLETIRRAILSIIEGDIRVILIRMAACLQDLEQANNLPSERRLEIASEGLNIYAPLANRLGVWHLKWGLEDLSFRHLEPEIYQEIFDALDSHRSERTVKITNAATQLQTTLEAMGIEALVTGRPKHIYSIYRKMQRKGTSLNNIYDIQALRVILEPRDPEAYKKKNTKQKDEEDRILCYQVLGAVHSLWQPIPREFDDYIASPKPNGYKSLHTAVIDPEASDTLEVQIRSVRMHNEAEKGIASHWAYKEDGAEHVSASVQRRIHSLRELLTSLKEEEDGSFDEDSITKDVLGDQIHVYTPRGDVVELPEGSTPIDFAYHIHTQVGHRCRGAKVNDKWVALDYRLHSGDRVEILTGKRPNPSRDWMNPSFGYTASGRTRAKIRQWFRAQDRNKNIQQGRDIVERELKRLGLSDTFSVNDIAQALKYDDVEQFLAKVGFGDFQSAQISGAITILRRDLEPDDELQPLLEPIRPKAKGITVRGVSGLPTKMAGCCNPIPPEPIIGYITRGTGVTIHKRDCEQFKLLEERERIIDVDWGAEAKTFPIPIIVEAYRRGGLVDEMAQILKNQHITAPKTKTISENGILKVYLVVEVIDMAQLSWLLKKFESLQNVISAQRQRWN